jgi:hypothetical protein
VGHDRTQAEHEIRFGEPLVGRNARAVGGEPEFAQSALVEPPVLMHLEAAVVAAKFALQLVFCHQSVRALRGQE